MKRLFANPFSTLHLNVFGEVTLVIGPGEALKTTEQSQQGIKHVAQLLGSEWGMSKREAYNLLMTIKPEEE